MLTLGEEDEGEHVVVFCRWTMTAEAARAISATRDFPRQRKADFRNFLKLLWR
jgi:hypothetical protein